MTVSKENVALLVVLTDLVSVFVLWFALLALKKLHVMADNDINKGTVTPVDFTV